MESSQVHRKSHVAGLVCLHLIIYRQSGFKLTDIEDDLELLILLPLLPEC